LVGIFASLSLYEEIAVESQVPLVQTFRFEVLDLRFEIGCGIQDSNCRSEPSVTDRFLSEHLRMATQRR